MNEETKKEKSGLAIASLILAIIGLIMAIIPIIRFIAYPLAIVALILGIIPLCQKKSIVIAIVAIVLAVAAFVLTISLQAATTKAVVDVFQEATGDLDESPSKETGGTAESNTDSDNQNNDVFHLNDTAVFEKLKITAVEIKESLGESLFEPESGNVFVGVKFSIENVSSEDQSISSLLLFDAYESDVKLDYSFTAACAFDDGTLDGTIAPGKKLVGWYAVEVPSNWSNLQLNVKSSWLSHRSAEFVFEK